MIQSIPMEMNFLAAMLHGRRSRLAEDGRLDELSLIRTVQELGRALYPDEILLTASALQRRMVTGLLNELNRLSGGLEQDRRELLSWLRVRFQVENLKVLARGRTTHVALEKLLPYLIPLPRDLTLDAQQLVSARSIDEFFEKIQNSTLSKHLQSIRGIWSAQSSSFYIEAALDYAYLSELVFRAQGLSGEDRLSILEAIRQEVDLFHLLLVVRGKLGYGLKPETLLGLHVCGGGLTREQFAALLAAGDLDEIVQRAVGRVIDTRPRTGTAAELETLAWNRLLRLANKAFRCGHMGMGAVVGYTILRRVELANLITLCEGIRTGIAPAILRARLIPRAGVEAVHV